MLNSTKPSIRSLYAALAVVVSFAIFYSVPSWSLVVNWLNVFLFSNGEWQTFFRLGILIALLRYFLMKSKPRLVTAWLVYGFFYLMIFRSRWFPYGAHPTFLLILIFLHAVALFLLCGLDTMHTFAVQFLQRPKLRDLKRPWVSFVCVFVGIWFVQYSLLPQVTDPWQELLVSHTYFLILLVPFISGLFRYRSLRRPMDYSWGILLNAVAVWVVFGAPYLRMDTFLMALIPFYLAFWGHAYLEECGTMANRAIEPLRRTPVGVWLFEKWTRLGKEPSAAETAPTPLSDLHADLMPRIRAWWEKIKGQGTGATQSLARYKKIFRGLTYAAVLMAACAWIAPKIYQRFFVTVIEFTPTDEVKNRVVIRITFSEPIDVLNHDISKVDCFKIDPPLAGSYRQEGEKTIVFVPTDVLNPSSDYRVRFDPKNITAPHKRIQSRASTEFHTEYFAVTDTKLFYSYDLVTNEERQLMGEIDFNFPVSVEEVRKNLQVFKGKDLPVPVEIEKAHIPTRFYFKTGALKREEQEQVMTLRLAKGMHCINGNVGLADDFTKTQVLPSKIKLEVSELKLWHEPGNTFVTILFNMPISENQVQSHLSVTPAVPFHIETEYCYAVLRGDFKPNVTYNVVVQKGLIAKSGESLENEYKGAVTIEDMPAKAEFAYKGNILSLRGPKNIAIRTTNLDKVDVQVNKIFRNNLIQFLGDERYSPMSQSIFNGSYNVEGGQINEEMTQYINLEKYHNAPYKGLFQITLKDPSNYNDQQWAWFLCTDLGIIAKHSGEDLIVYVMSIEHLTPEAGATVEMYSDNNQVMDKQVTNDAGKVVFLNWRKNEFHFNPHFLVVQKNEDFSFLYFNNTALNQNQFAVGGDPYGREGMEAYLTPERGVYRPGEKAYITAVVRNSDGTTPPVLPVRLSVRDPRGAEYLHIEQSYNTNGMVSFTIPFAGDALTGQYELQLTRMDKPESLGSTALKVEEFIPDKLKVEVVTPKEAIKAGEPLIFKVKSRQMFGPPANGNKVVTSVRFLSREFSNPHFKNFTFSDASRQFEDDEEDLGQDKLDAKGEKEYTVELPHATPPSALKAYIYTEVDDSGGRPVSAAGYVDIHPYTHYLGVKLSSKETIHEKQKVTLDYVAISPDGHLQNVDKVRLVIKRKAWYSIFRSSSWGRSGYQSSPFEELIENREVSVHGQGTLEFTPEQPGEYTAILASPNGMRTGISFEVLGLGYETTSLESPEKLKMVLDKDAYEVGEQAHVLIQTPFTGKLILTLEREKVYETRIVEVTGHETAVDLPIESKCLPNMYIVGMLIRTPDESRKSLPMVSFGIASLNVKSTSKRVGMAWSVAKAVQSSDGIDASLHVTGDPEQTDVVLVAVDQGILQITNFTTPNPLEYFYRKRSLTTQTYSIFDLVLPDLIAQKFALGGDEGAKFSRRHLNPIAAKKKKSMAIYSGLLKPDANGNVHYHFDTKDFNGEVRLMALAVNGDRYGASETPVTVADPIVLIPNFPRFVGPLDQFQIPVEIYNKTGQSGNFVVRINVKGPLKITGPSEQTVALDPEDQKRMLFFAEALNDAGVAKIAVRASGGGYHSVHEEELAVRPYTHLVTRIDSGEVAPGQSTTLNVPGGLIPFGQMVRMTVSNNPVVKYLRSLDYLISYPYGCAEQVTSRIFPLIYFKNLGFATGRFEDKANAVDYFIQEGIHTLEKQQLPDGQFTMWPGGEVADPWLTHYICHCLIEAQRMGYSVSPLVRSRINALVLRGSVAPVNQGRLDRRQQNTETQMDTYLMYLKALIGQPDMESMAFLRANKLKDLSETDRALLSMSYSHVGDHQTAEQILTPDFKSKFLYREQYGSYNSPIRNTAMYLSALVQANPLSPKIFQIVDYLGQQIKDGHFGNTQEDVWTFTALAQVFKAFETPIQMNLQINGQPYKSIDGTENSFTDNALSGKKLLMTNAGAQKSFYYLMSEGTPLEKNTRHQSNGLTIERSFYDKSGKPVNLSNIVQGDLLVVTLTVRAKDKPVSNVVVVDLLPAGLEIENPRLSSRGQLDYEPPYDFTPTYQDIRDDRILLFSNEISGEHRFSYTVRAVTPGHFNIPNAYAEAMYDPDINAESYESNPMVIADNNAQQ